MKPIAPLERGSSIVESTSVARGPKTLRPARIQQRSGLTRDVVSTLLPCSERSEADWSSAISGDWIWDAESFWWSGTIISAGRDPARTARRKTVALDEEVGMGSCLQGVRSWWPQQPGCAMIGSPLALVGVFAALSGTGRKVLRK